MNQNFILIFNKFKIFSDSNGLSNGISQQLPVFLNDSQTRALKMNCNNFSNNNSNVGDINNSTLDSQNIFLAPRLQQSPGMYFSQPNSINFSHNFQQHHLQQQLITNKNALRDNNSIDNSTNNSFRMLYVNSQPINANLIPENFIDLNQGLIFFYFKIFLTKILKDVFCRFVIAFFVFAN